MLVKRDLRVRLALLALGAAALVLADGSPGTEDLMVRAAENFVTSLDAEQRPNAVFAFDSPDRELWHFLPTYLLENGPPGGIPPDRPEFRVQRPRQGLAHGRMKPYQRRLADALLATAFSQYGMYKATTIMSLETMLAERNFDPMGNNYGKAGPEIHDVDYYHLAVFGEPSSRGAWGWRLEGHHISVNMTMKDGQLVGTTPIFLGSEPHRVRDDKEEPRLTYLGYGYPGGFRVLGEREDLGRALVTALDPEQQARAIFQKEANDVILIETDLTFDRQTAPAGFPVSRMNTAQKRIVREIFLDHAGAMPPVIAAARMRQADRDLDEFHFAWAGGIEAGDQHYYRPQGPNFLVEWDCIQSKANHSHSIWRDYKNDFGRKLLTGRDRRYDHDNRVGD